MKVERERLIGITDNHTTSLEKFKESVFKVIDEISTELEQRAKNGDGSPETLTYYTKKMLNDWFFNKGYL